MKERRRAKYNMYVLGIVFVFEVEGRGFFYAVTWHVVDFKIKDSI